MLNIYVNIECNIINVNIDIINYINWLRSVNCGIALISPFKIDWLFLNIYVWF